MIKIAIEPGDLFTKVNSMDTVWVVDRILEFDDAPLHVRLVEKGGNERTATLSYVALMNPKLWKPVKNQE